VAEAGLPALEFGSWNGVHAPAGTPKPIIDKLNAAIGDVRQQADVQRRMTELGLLPEGGAAAAFGDFVKRDIARWRRIVDETGVKIE
jgi:tripartite-type tricarboxylate transporter receptor subunit TctC